ncbi:hypothetical protein AALP_AA6G016700 [Arabis alpina]|uniref:Uncharacterized protein n=1 Tax=Arabis alpina TaxID=50452 RepID=A0A087GLF1_ARAAL|nr:hypothetical protein AALP_AA6G016700 [Arabis alpina]
MDQQNLFHSFGLYIGKHESGPMSLTVEYEFSAWSKTTKDFVRQHKATYKFTGAKSFGSRNLLAIPWESFMSKTCPYFINDVLHLRAQLSICP